MKITSRTTIKGVALAVGGTLAAYGIRAILTGGACASLHSDGRYVSNDLDFVLEGRVLPGELDEAMAALGFVRETNRYVHPRSRFWVEFPRGPLGVGADLGLVPVRLGEGAESTLALSATDSCRDRLAAFYHWNDRQSLATAVAIARRREIDHDLIRQWSVKEGHASRWEEFRREVARRALRSTPRNR